MQALLESAMAYRLALYIFRRQSVMEFFGMRQYDITRYGMQEYLFSNLSLVPHSFNGNLSSLSMRACVRQCRASSSALLLTISFWMRAVSSWSSSCGGTLEGGLWREEYRESNLSPVLIIQPTQLQCSIILLHMLQKKLQTYIDGILVGDDKVRHQEYALTGQEIGELQMMCGDRSAQEYFDKLMELNQEEQEKMEGVENVCYVGMGKKMVRASEQWPKYHLSFNNMYIRGEMMPSIIEYITNKAKSFPNTVFLLPNQNGINFPTNKRPKVLDSYIESKQYQEILRHVNNIIQTEIYRHRYRQKPQKNWLCIIALLIVLTMIVIILNIVIMTESTVIGMCLVLSITLISILAYSLQTYREELNTSPLIMKICEEIHKYFTFLNGISKSDLEWKIGHFFFWIQIKINK